MTHRFDEDRARGVKDRRFSAMSSRHIDRMGYLAEWRAAYELGLWGDDAKAIDGPDRGYDLLLRSHRLEVKWISYDRLREFVIPPVRTTADIVVAVFGSTEDRLHIEGWLTKAEVMRFPLATLARSGKRLPKPGHMVPTEALHDMRSLRRLA